MEIPAVWENDITFWPIRVEDSCYGITYKGTPLQTLGKTECVCACYHLTDIFDELQRGVVEGQMWPREHGEHFRGLGHAACAAHLFLDLLRDGEDVLRELARHVLLREGDHPCTDMGASLTTYTNTHARDNYEQLFFLVDLKNSVLTRKRADVTSGLLGRLASAPPLYGRGSGSVSPELLPHAVIHCGDVRCQDETCKSFK